MSSAIEVEDRTLPGFLDGVTKGMLIGGRWVPAKSGATFDAINPSTEQKIASVAAGDLADVDAAVGAAQRAFDDRAWSRMNPRERTRVLLRLADAVDAHADELAELETLDNGMPYAFSSYIMPFRTEEEVLAKANDTTYGLAAAVATTDVSRAHRMARDLDAGVVSGNTYNELDPIFPFGGFEQSGLGRELGEQSLDNFTEVKSVLMRL